MPCGRRLTSQLGQRSVALCGQSPVGPRAQLVRCEMDTGSPDCCALSLSFARLPDFEKGGLGHRGRLSASLPSRLCHFTCRLYFPPLLTSGHFRHGAELHFWTPATSVRETVASEGSCSRLCIFCARLLKKKGGGGGGAG